MIITVLRSLHKASSSENSRFWIGQLLTITFTITGIYLAAVVGYERAVAYDQLLLKQNQYYLLSSLYEEVKDNVKRVDNIVDNIEHSWVKKAELDLYLWEHAPKNPDTHKIPSSIRTSTQRFYQAVKKIIAKTYGITTKPTIAEELKELKNKFEQQIFPQYEAELQRLYLLLEKGGITPLRPIEF